MTFASSGARQGTKGFTLIELLVVIAIIGILSAVVLASLSTARGKGKDASMEESMSSMRAAAEIYYGNNSNSYGTVDSCTAATGMFADTTSNMKGLAAAVNSAGGTAARNAETSVWAVSSTFPSGASGYFCVDSTGAAKTETGTPVANATSCP